MVVLLVWATVLSLVNVCTINTCARVWVKILYCLVELIYWGIVVACRVCHFMSLTCLFLFSFLFFFPFPSSNPSHPNDILSMTQLKKMPFKEQVRALLINGRCWYFAVEVLPLCLCKELGAAFISCRHICFFLSALPSFRIGISLYFIFFMFPFVYFST